MKFLCTLWQQNGVKAIVCTTVLHCQILLFLTSSFFNFSVCLYHFICRNIIKHMNMASGSVTKSATEESVTCLICQETLQAPRRLECLHCFCHKCLKNVDRVREGGKKGILCPLCRKFTSEPKIQNDQLLEVLIEAFGQFYDKNIRNPDVTDVICTQCDTKINVINYCIECKANLCDTCKIRHLRFEALSEHKIVPIKEAGKASLPEVIKFCPHHPAKPLKLSCVDCKLAICVDCKIQDHDTHKTEDIQSALGKVLPELKSMRPLLDTEREKQIDIKQQLVATV